MQRVVLVVGQMRDAHGWRTTSELAPELSFSIVFGPRNFLSLELSFPASRCNWFAPLASTELCALYSIVLHYTYILLVVRDCLNKRYMINNVGTSGVTGRRLGWHHRRGAPEWKWFFLQLNLQGFWINYQLERQRGDEGVGRWTK